MHFDIRFAGIFVNREELLALMDKIGLGGDHLYRIINDPHVTVAFQPKEVDENLFGTKILLKIKGYANDGKNEGFKVDCITDGIPDDLKKLISTVDVPHITVSVSEQGDSYETRFLDFKPLDNEEEIEGTFGIMTDNKQVIINDLYNSAFLFVPFSYNDLEFHEFVNTISRSTYNDKKIWEKQDDDLRYVYSYITQKMDISSESGCLFYHFLLTGDSLKTLLPETGHELQRKDAEAGLPGFYITAVHLYCFGTKVCIAAVNIHFEKTDIKSISDALYHLKKISRTEIIKLEQRKCKEADKTGNDRSTTLLEEVKKCISISVPDETFNYFYYIKENKARANVFVYAEKEDERNIRENLWFLRNCYSPREKFSYTSDIDSNQEIYRAAKNTFWGITKENLAAVVILSDFGRNFIKETFRGRIENQYLFTYVFVLHQRYVYYLFMTKLGPGYSNNLEQLETYQSELYEFETDFAFHVITDVSQYQNLYEKILNVIDLNTMAEDINEPITRLSQLREKEREKAEEKRNNSINKALAFLSILSAFSALIDSYTWIREVFKPAGPTWISVISWAASLIIVMIVVYVIVILYRAKGRR